MMTFARDAKPTTRKAMRELGNQARMIGIIILALIVATLVMPLAIAILAVGLVGLLIWAWVHEFVILMHLRDTDFPGRSDKLVWSILMILLPPIGVVAFWTYRSSRTTDAPTASTKPTRDDWS